MYAKDYYHSVVKEHPWAVYLTCSPEGVGTLYNGSVSTLVYESVLMFVGAVEMLVPTLADNAKVK